MLAPGQNEVNALCLDFNRITALPNEIFLLNSLSVLHCLHTVPFQCLCLLTTAVFPCSELQQARGASAVAVAADQSCRALWFASLGTHPLWFLFLLLLTPRFFSAVSNNRLKTLPDLSALTELRELDSLPSTPSPPLFRTHCTLTSCVPSLVQPARDRSQVDCQPALRAPRRQPVLQEASAAPVQRRDCRVSPQPAVTPRVSICRVSHNKTPQTPQSGNSESFFFFCE